MRKTGQIRGWGFSLADPEILIVVTGMPGAGKDEFIGVCREFGFTDLHMGEAVRRYAARNGIEISDSEIGKFATSERAAHGMDIWARRTLIDGNGKRLVIDGLRNYEELEYFKNELGGDKCYLIAVFANRNQRLERIMKRNRTDDIHSLEELIARDERELKWGIGKAIALSDIMLVNNTTLEHFKKESRAVVRKLLKLPDDGI